MDEPLIPQLHQSPVEPGFVQNPYPFYQKVHALGGTFVWEDYRHVCLAGFADVSRTLRDKRFGRDVLHITTRQALGWPEPAAHLAPWLSVEAHSMLEREPPVHTRLRGLVNRAFVSRSIERLRPEITALCHRLIDQMPGREAFDLLSTYAEPIPVHVIAGLLGVDPLRAPDLLAWSHAMVAMYQFDRSRAVEDRAVAASQAFVAFLSGLIDQRRKAPGDDLISTLIEAEAGGDRLSRDELISTVILLLNAGHEATVHAIGNGVAALLSHGLAPGELFSSAASTSATIEELLRFDTPLHMFTRYALEPVEIAGHRLRVGDRIGLLLGAANWDPARFSKPDVLDVQRTDPGNVSFGGGIHFCIGAPLARLELELALPILFQRRPDLKLAEPPVFANRYHFRGLERLMLA